MFLLGPSAGILPYLLAILVSLVYYIEGETTVMVDILPQSTIEKCLNTNIIVADCFAEIRRTDEATPELLFVIPVSCGNNIYPFKIPPSIQFSNGPLRAPPYILV
jgi:hypothetical protein